MGVWARVLRGVLMGAALAAISLPAWASGPKRDDVEYRQEFWSRLFHDEKIQNALRHELPSVADNTLDELASRWATQLALIEVDLAEEWGIARERVWDSLAKFGLGSHEHIFRGPVLGTTFFEQFVERVRGVSPLLGRQFEDYLIRDGDFRLNFPWEFVNDLPVGNFELDTRARSRAVWQNILWNIGEKLLIEDYRLHFDHRHHHFPERVEVMAILSSSKGFFKALEWNSELEQWVADDFQSFYDEVLVFLVKTEEAIVILHEIEPGQMHEAMFRAINPKWTDTTSRDYVPRRYASMAPDAFRDIYQKIVAVLPSLGRVNGEPPESSCEESVL